MIVAMVIASIKAALVVLYFMHVKYASRLTKVFVAAAFLWLAILFALTFADYLTPRLAAQLPRLDRPGRQPVRSPARRQTGAAH